MREGEVATGGKSPETGGELDVLFGFHITRWNLCGHIDAEERMGALRETKSH